MNSRFTESLRPNRKLNLTTNTMMLLTHLAFFLFEEERVKNLYLIVGAIVTAYFLGMRLLTYQIKPLYPVADVVLQHRLFLCNALLTLLLCVFDVGMFTKILLTLTNGLQYTSTHDPLTDLYNRRRMMEIMGEKQSRAAVAILDIDDFKQINDTYGHAAGDAVIKALAGRLKALGDRGIVSGRWGGEEFVTFVSGKDGAPDRMEDDLRALVHEVAGSPVEYGGHRIGYTVTIGMKLSDDGEDIQKAIALRNLPSRSSSAMRAFSCIAATLPLAVLIRS
ncbi:MAG: GGDEF domain-containing protein [Clostridia bacterium]|nr:GGDEF domain-containing protein [Clostridia bacterium]